MSGTNTLEARYMESCKRHKVSFNSAVISWLRKKCGNQNCTRVVFVDELEDADISPLIDVFHDTRLEAISILCRNSCVLNHASMIRLLTAASSKLRDVDLQDITLAKDIIESILHGGLNCHTLKLRFNELQTLNVAGRFKLLNTLNLDFCSSLTTIEKDCFANVPNLMRLSMCGTSVANLWTTGAALSRLTSLVELRFQSCMCCKDTGPCPALSGKTHGAVNMHADDPLAAVKLNNLHGINSINLNLSHVPVSNEAQSLHIEVCHGKFLIQDEDESPTSVLRWEQEDSVAPEAYVLQCPSPICFERHYREYVLTTLPHLQVLDNFLVTKREHETAKTVFSMSFEHLPYKRQLNESITSILHSREAGLIGKLHNNISRSKHPTSCEKNQVYYSRSLLASKFASSVSPVLLPMSRIGHNMKYGEKGLRPRQFEYHPSDASLIAFGTLDGEVVIINHETGRISKCIPSFQDNDRALALCWLNKHPSKLLAGFDNGALRLYDINQISPKVEDSYWTSNVVNYDDFEKLTSVHVNSTDEKFLASNYSRNVAIFDVCSGARMQLFSCIHQEPINVAKFAQHSPHLLVTSSFDREVKMWDLRRRPVQPCYTTSSSKGNVMVCFSPNDLYLLVSAVDNEVRQLLAVDGRLHTNFDIASTGSSHNYTRSYYMNGRDYIISGSCEESVVRVCCGQTGKRLRDIDLKDGSSSSFLVHSLRSDPFRHFNMAVLAGSPRCASPWDIIKVNMLSSNNCQDSDIC